MESEGRASPTGPSRVVVHTPWVQELESPSSLGTSGLSTVVPPQGIGLSRPTHPACSPMSR